MKAGPTRTRGRPAVRDAQLIRRIQDMLRRAHPELGEGSVRQRADEIERFLRLAVEITPVALAAFAAGITPPQRSHFRLGWEVYAQLHGLPVLPEKLPIITDVELLRSAVESLPIPPTATQTVVWSDIVLAGEQRSSDSIRAAPVWRWWIEGAHYVLRWRDGTISRGFTLADEGILSRLAARSLCWSESSADQRVPHPATQFGLPMTVEAARMQVPNAAILAPFPGAPVGISKAVVRPLE